MAASAFGWMTIDAAALRQVRRELDVDEGGVLDEMGVGLIHTGYANRFFPGTSVLQTRARYVFFTAWTFLALASKRVRDDRFEERKRKIEATVTGRLISRYTKGPGSGILGVRIFPRRPVQPPDFVYWTALREWGLYEGVPRSSLLARWDPKRIAQRGGTMSSREEDIAVVPLAIFDVPAPPPDWPEEDSQLSFNLTHEEATWLRDRWTRMGSANLLSACAELMEAPSMRPGAPLLWDDELVKEAASELDAAHRGEVLPSFREALLHARQASALAELVRATYAAFVEREYESDLKASERSAADVPHDRRTTLDMYLTERDGTRLEALDLSVDELLRDLPELARTRWHIEDLLRNTQGAWREARLGNDIVANRQLRMQYEQVERARKGSLRARLAPLEGKERRVEFFASQNRTSGLDYRWQATRRLMLDVFEGLHGGRDR